MYYYFLTRSVLIVTIFSYLVYFSFFPSMNIVYLSYVCLYIYKSIPEIYIIRYAYKSASEKDVYVQ